MTDRTILLVEDNPDDEALTLRALKKNNILNPVTVVRDGAEALDYLFCQRAYAGRDASRQPAVTLLLPVVILTSSKEEQDLVNGYRNGANSYIRKPVDFTKFMEAVRQLGLYWLVLNEPPPANAKH